MDIPDKDIETVLNALGLDLNDWNEMSDRLQDALLRRFVYVTVNDLSRHTKGPFRVGHENGWDQTFIPRGAYYIFDGRNDIMGLVCWNINGGDRRANADFMVQAMNELERRENNG